MNLTEVKAASLGKWKSITPEIRPSNSKNPDGTLKPFYLSREFSMFEGDRFELIVTTLNDPYAKVPLARMVIRGHMEWKGDHPIASGAQKVDFTADEDYAITPLNANFAGVLNQYTKGYSEWKVGESQSILKKAFSIFNLSEGQIFKEFDLIYLYNDMMFWGSRNIDGRGFDTDQNRPTNLQIPMIRDAD